MTEDQMRTIFHEVYWEYVKPYPYLDIPLDWDLFPPLHEEYAIEYIKTVEQAKDDGLSFLRRRYDIIILNFEMVASVFGVPVSEIVATTESIDPEGSSFCMFASVRGLKIFSYTAEEEVFDPDAEFYLPLNEWIPIKEGMIDDDKEIRDIRYRIYIDAESIFHLLSKRISE